MRIGVVIATKGRPHAISQLLKLLERQTLLPTIVLVSASDQTDVESGIVSPMNVEFIFGPAGLCMQRNRGLNKIRSECDAVIFFDDDFVLSPDWIEQCARIFESDSSVVGVTGVLIRDGAKTEEIAWEEAISLVETRMPAISGASVPSVCKDLYGCNMAFRMHAVDGSSFDERLVLYGWMEDADFSRRVGRKGRLVKSGAMVGVHLGIKSGRISGKRYGYSQMINPWYLHKKGTLTAMEAGSKIMRPLLMNAAKAFRPEKDIDRLGRFGGNIIGLGHLMVGQCRPEAAGEL